ncbi:MAG: dTDP-4-dehydrorhamnose reductase, partial [Pyrinomonadaceae bacterium]|nr:dTDP-4-dehydrorhamnose reductase [Pyrinomonadaceae bacterium]
MKILITGANGLVGGETVSYCRSIGDEVSAMPRESLDIADRNQVFDFVTREKPDSIINCAAWTDVDGCELNPEKNYSINAFGVENLASACKKVGANFVTISTDYVFDGAKNGFYTQRDDVNPTSIYGQAKLEGERLAMKSLARAIVVRSGWIFGTNGRNFLSKMPELLAAGKTIKAISDAHGTPTFAPDLAKRLRELAEADLPAIYHVVNAGEGTTYELFARTIADKLPNAEQSQIEAVSGSTLKRPAPRPDNSKMSCLISEKLGFAPLPNWTDALERYLNSPKSKV